jgi:hypothetical protein
MRSRKLLWTPYLCKIFPSGEWMIKTNHTFSLNRKMLHQSIQLYFCGHNSKQPATVNVPPVPLHYSPHTHALSHSTTVLSFSKHDVYIFKLFCSLLPFSVRRNTTALQNWTRSMLRYLCTCIAPHSIWHDSSNCIMCHVSDILFPATQLLSGMV